MSTTSDESDVVTPRTRNGVPLRKNSEYRLSLPYTNNIDIVEHPQYQSTTITTTTTSNRHSRKDSANSLTKDNSKQLRSLPPNWTLQLTEDGTDCYYYNNSTGEMRSSHPDDASESEFEDGASYANGSIEEDDYDFKSVDSRLPWDDAPLPPQPPTAPLDRLDNLSNPEKVLFSGPLFHFYPLYRYTLFLVAPSRQNMHGQNCLFDCRSVDFN